MSFKNGELHALAVVGAMALTAGLAVPTLYWTRDAEAQSSSDLDKMVVIEAALAQKGTKPKNKQPQKAPPEVKVKPEGVSRDDKKVPPENKPDKDKPKVTDPAAKAAPDRRPTDEVPSTGPVETPGSETGSTEGRGTIDKGHPYFVRITPNTELPELASGNGIPVRCITLNPDNGTIKTLTAPTRTGDDLDTLADAAMQELRAKLEANPEPVPTELLSLTSKPACFRFIKVKP